MAGSKSAEVGWAAVVRAVDNNNSTARRLLGFGEEGRGMWQILKLAFWERTEKVERSGVFDGLDAINETTQKYRKKQN